MKRKLSICLSLIFTIGAVAGYSVPSFAQEGVAELKKQIEALQTRVEELESQQRMQEKKEDLLRGSKQGRWDPFEEIDRMQEEMNRMFQSTYSRTGGTGRGMFSNDMSYDYDFDIKETKDGYEIRFEMKGLDQEKVDIQINEHSITVKGERSEQQTQEGENRFFSAQSFGSFMKTIPLPVDADTSKVKTEKEGDSLVIKLPKKTS